MNIKDMQNGLRQYLSFLEQRIQEAQTIKLPMGLVLEHAPPEVARNYMVAREKEVCYRRAEEELRRLFPEIDFYDGSLERIAKKAAEFEDRYFAKHPDAPDPFPLIGRPTGKLNK